MFTKRSRILLLAVGVCLFNMPLKADPVLTNLALWLEGNVGWNGTTWIDQSGNGHNATAITAPTTTSINGLQALRFAGGQSLSIAGQVLTDPLNYTVMALVTDSTNSPFGFREIFSNWDTTNRLTSVFLGTTNFNPNNVRFTDEVGGATDTHGRVQNGQGVLVNPTNPFILTGNSSSATAKIFQNGTLLFDNVTPISARNLTTGYFIGKQGSLNGEFWRGDIAEILVYNSSLSSADFNTNINYLTNKWVGSSSVPEPTTFALLCLGLAAMVAVQRNRARG